MAGRVNFSVRVGETFTKVITWKDEDEELIDLSGFTASFTVLDADGATVFALSQASGITLGGAAGTIVLLKQTVGLAAGCNTHLLTVTSPGGVVTDLMEGEFDLTS